MAEVDIPASDNVELSSDSHLDLDSHYGQDDPDLQLNEALEDAFYQHDFDNAFLNPNAAIDDALWEVFQEQFRPTPNNQTPIQRYSPIPQLPPDFDPQPPPPDMASSEGTTYGTPIELDDLEDATAILTDESCLQHVLEVFPDISLQHVRDLYNKAPPGLSDGEQWLQTFIGNIVESGKYPTEKEAQKGQKRKRDAEDEQDLSDSGEEQNASDKAYADAA